MTKRLNLSGPQIRRLRYSRDWSQSVLAARLQLLGWDIDRAGVAKIEAQLVHVDDYELLYFARVFNVSLLDLFPRIDPERRLDEVLNALMRRALSQASSRKKVPFCSQTGTVMRSPTAMLAGNVS